MTERIEITGLAYGGAGVGRTNGRMDGKVVFVPYTAPGDVATIEIIADKGRFLEARLVKLINPSPARQKPPCPVFGKCGGCQWQHIKYDAQLAWKGQIFSETMRRIGKTEFAETQSPVPAPAEFGYRSRARFHVSAKEWGFHESGTNSVVDIGSCPLLVDGANEIFLDIKRAVEDKVPTLTSVEIGCSEEDSRATAIFHLKSETRFDWQAALAGISLLKGYEVRVSPKRHGPQRTLLTSGDARLKYCVEKESIEASLGVFTQVNLAQNRALVGRAIDFAGAAGDGHSAIDLFSGVGNFTLPLARRFKKVFAVEEHKDASKLAEANARRNGISNVSFSTLSAHGWLTDRLARGVAGGKADVVVLDPPRGGDKPVASALRALGPKRIVYVSCGPATLARDVAELTTPRKEGSGDFAYRPSAAVVVDMFPETYHIEAVVALERK